MTEWDYSLASTRPIMLLETARKSLVRIIQKRLGKVIKEKQILKGLNFMGLEGENTFTPIHILHNLIEDAKQHNKEMWILLQDIRKAFDSVSMIGVKKALNRIKIYGKLENFILELYTGRRIKIITAGGLTEGFQAEDGIDQGEVISPLIWRIFYDPLLCRIQNTEKGYEMGVERCINLERKENIRETYNTSCLAFADDTMWIAKTDTEMQQIVNKAQEFYKLNDIEINPKKSELVIINKNRTRETSGISLGKTKEKVAEKSQKDLSRFLGIWIGARNQEKNIKNRIKRDISCFIYTIGNKWISAGQIKYLNNKVLLPRLEYRLMTTHLNKDTCDNLYQPIIRLAKRKTGIASSAANILMINEDLIGIKTLWQKHIEQSITEWTIRINDKNLLGQTTRGRLRQAQIDLLSTEPI